MNRLASRVFFAGLMAVVATLPSTTFAAPTRTFPFGSTEVTLASSFTAAAQSLGVAITVLRPGFVSGKKPAFSVSSAVLDYANAKGEIVHNGGIRFKAGAVVVDLQNFIIDTTGTPKLTAIASINGSVVGRIDAFSVGLPALTLPLKGNTKLAIPAATLTLTATAAGAFNSAFGVSAFTEGLSIGKATVRLQR